jgi:PAS domain S-box-containing protein
MIEERRARGDLLQELDYLRNHIALFEQAEQKIVNEESEKPKRWFRSTFDNITEGVLLTDLKNKQIITSNKKICQMLGYSLEEITNLEITSICPPEDSYYLIRQFEVQADGDLVFRKDIPFQRKDGDFLHADIISIALTYSAKRYLISFLRETLAQKNNLALQQNTYMNFQASQLLTKTEMRILRLIIKGKSNKEIAKLFHRSIRTIENHRSHLMKKLGVDNSIELVTQSIKMGIVDFPGE